MYERIAQLTVLCKKGDKKALEELLNTYEKLINKYVNNYYIKGYDEEDLKQIAKMAIIRSVQKYDTSMGANFTGFLDIVLRNTFGTMIRRKENTATTFSLNKIVNDDSNDAKEFVELLEDPINIEEDFIEKIKREGLGQALSKLTKEERELIAVVFSNHGGLKRYTKIKGIDYARGRRMRDRVIKKLRKVMSPSVR